MTVPPRDRTRRVTLLAVVQAAGVSRATASLVVRRSPLVGQATRDRVEAAIRDLRYVYDVGEARLREGRSRTMGVVLPNLSNPFFADMLTGIEAVLDAEDMAVMVANSRDSPAKQDVFARRMREHDVAGIILCAATDTPDTFLNRARGWGMPAVQALRRIFEGTDCAGTDYAGGMRQVVRHFAGLGHRRITFVAGDRDHPALRERLSGFALGAELGLETEVAAIPLAHGCGRAVASDLRTGFGPPTAIVCFNDVVALGLLKGLRDLGLRVGRDVSVAGFDDIPEAALAYPALTSVETRPTAIGEAAAGLLL